MEDVSVGAKRLIRLLERPLRRLWHRSRVGVTLKPIAAAFVAAAVNAGALAAPPPGTDLSSPTHKWFEMQYNTQGELCCDVSDGHMIDERDVRMTEGAYEVRIDGEWYPVGPSAMRDAVRGGPNPTGHPIVWYTRTFTRLPGLVISCFAPGTLF
jgi:hypothetical protein